MLLIGKPSLSGPFSIAMLNYQRVYITGNGSISMCIRLCTDHHLPHVFRVIHIHTPIFMGQTITTPYVSDRLW